MAKFKIERKKLLKALQNVSSVIRDNRTMPVVSGALIEVKEKDIEIRGTDLDINIISSVSANIEEIGSFVIKPNALQEYLKEISDEYVEIEKKGNSVRIISSKSQSEFTTYNHEEYPEFPNFKPEVNFELNATTLAEGIDRVIVGAALSSDNLAVNCIRVDLTKNRLRLVSSDTYRMFFYEVNAESNASIESRTSVPLKTALVVNRLIKINNLNKISISRNRNLISFKLDNVEVFSKIIDLPYPDYENILSNLNFDKNILCGSEELVSTLKRVQIFARENTDVRNGALFNFNNEKLFVEATSDLANIKEEMQIVKNGDDVKIFLNVKFVLDFLTEIEGNVNIKLRDSNSAILLTQEGKENFLCLAMPLAYNY